jgi:SAM-dependent methyltransferase
MSWTDKLRFAIRIAHRRVCLSTRVTRGHGFLEPTLAKLRASKANALISPEQRKGRILDFGCGSFPYFLISTAFAEKHGLDKMVANGGGAVEGVPADIQLAALDIYDADRLPYADNFFDVVTMLAVFEHIRIDRLTMLITEIHRVLKPGCSYIMTTPSGWTGPVLDALKTLGAVSKEEIDEHEDSYSARKIRAIMAKTPFPPDRTRIGYFELGMNVWMCARKHGG